MDKLQLYFKLLDVKPRYKNTYKPYHTPSRYKIEVDFAQVKLQLTEYGTWILAREKKKVKGGDDRGPQVLLLHY